MPASRAAQVRGRILSGAGCNVNLKPEHIFVFVIGAAAAGIIGYLATNAFASATGKQSHTVFSTGQGSVKHHDHSPLVPQSPPLRHRAGTHKKGSFRLVKQV